MSECLTRSLSRDASKALFYLLLMFNPKFATREVEQVQPLPIVAPVVKYTEPASFIAALQELWDEVFPVAEYPVQRLTKETAKMWIRKYGDDFVREVLIDVRHTTTKKIDSPRGYVNRVLESQWEKRSAPINSVSEITDEMRELLRLGGRQLREQHKDSGRGI